jgi:hypothetical protein
VLATARKNSLTRMVESSMTNRVLDLTSVPVEVVVGDSVSKLERYGIPLGLEQGSARVPAGTGLTRSASDRRFVTNRT